MSANQTLLPGPFKVLVDNPSDGVSEEWCWVPVAYAATEEEAIKLAYAENACDSRDKLVSQGKEWWRRDPAFKTTDRSTWRNESEDFSVDYEPWIPCSKWAKTGIEVWRLEITEASS